MGELSLRNYRANPSNSTFNVVAKEYKSWLRGAGIYTIRKFPALYGDDSAIDDLTNEGLLELSKSARRFIWFCRRCGRAFIQHRDLVEHAREEHAVRGKTELVRLATFAECSARLAMNRTARRMITPEVPTELPDLGSIWTEETLAAEILIRKAERRMTADARRILRRILTSSKPDPIDFDDESGAWQLRRLLLDLAH